MGEPLPYNSLELMGRGLARAGDKELGLVHALFRYVYSRCRLSEERDECCTLYCKACKRLAVRDDKQILDMLHLPFLFYVIVLTQKGIFNGRV